MVRPLTLLLLVASAGVAVGAAYALSKPGGGPGGPGGPGGYTVQVVVEDTSGSTLTGARVFLDGGAFQTTNPLGVAVFTGVAGGNHSLTVALDGYVQVDETISVTQDSSVVVHLSPCVQQPCPSCQWVWDPTACRCSQLIPGFIEVSSTLLHVPLQWLVDVNLSLSQFCASAYPGNPGACSQTFDLSSAYPGCPYPNGYFIPVTGSLQDSRGNKICNSILAVSTPQPKIPFTSSDGFVSGNWVLQVPSETLTDSNGNFTLQFAVTIEVTSVDYAALWLSTPCGLPVPTSRQCPVEQPAFIEIDFRYPGTQVRKTTQVDAGMLICVYDNILPGVM